MEPGVGKDSITNPFFNIFEKYVKISNDYVRRSLVSVGAQLRGQLASPPKRDSSEEAVIWCGGRHLLSTVSLYLSSANSTGT